MTKVVDAAVVVLVYCLYRGNTKRSGVISAVRVETAVSRGTFLASLYQSDIKPETSEDGTKHQVCWGGRYKYNIHLACGIVK